MFLGKQDFDKYSGVPADTCLTGTSTGSYPTGIGAKGTTYTRPVAIPICKVFPLKQQFLTS